MNRLSLASLIALFILAGCSSSQPATDSGTRTETRISREAQLAALTDYETFDHTAYPTQAPVADSAVEHIVPAELMEGTASGGLSSQRRGFRIQLAFAQSKVVADRSISDFLTFWEMQGRNRPLEPVFDETPAVYTVFLQPYYRVRVGDFKTREEAEAVLGELTEEFPRAFVMVDIVNKVD